MPEQNNMTYGEFISVIENIEDESRRRNLIQELTREIITPELQRKLIQNYLNLYAENEQSSMFETSVKAFLESRNAPRKATISLPFGLFRKQTTWVPVKSTALWQDNTVTYKWHGADLEYSVEQPHSPLEFNLKNLYGREEYAVGTAVRKFGLAAYITNYFYPEPEFWYDTEYWNEKFDETWKDIYGKTITIYTIAEDSYTEKSSLMRLTFRRKKEYVEEKGNTTNDRKMSRMQKEI